MSAEDLDKLFRDKLQNKTVPPRNEAWERLQARMQASAEEQATPNPFLIPAATEEKEERSTVRMWYYSAAAAVTMLLSVGLWVNRENINPLQPSGTVATVQDTEKVPAQKNIPAQETAPVESSDDTVYNYPAAPASAAEQNQSMASVQTKTPTQAITGGDGTRPASRKVGTEKVTPVAPATTQPPAIMAVATPVKTQEAAKNAAETPTLEIIVKLDNAQATPSLAQASIKETDTPDTEDQPGTGRVLKGILKQVKNLKDGEKVNLSELGITKHTYALETRIGNKKISKTIEL
ncbi:hypothetical protein [Rufibacter tibetensis]|uniref:Uncharacterized protein n=1 Tax=Rufibacter tibetensis TaxID=512763 RepID=A0A0N7HWY8_9BACT|nr:hypothetical protein [Rufibacter tibetensis]ALJ00569.1 hypothetical protein DC20_18325 [Rufibacter tibetensis]